MNLGLLIVVVLVVYIVHKVDPQFLTKKIPGAIPISVVPTRKKPQITTLQLIMVFGALFLVYFLVRWGTYQSLPLESPSLDEVSAWTTGNWFMICITLGVIWIIIKCWKFKDAERKKVLSTSIVFLAAALIVLVPILNVVHNWWLEFQTPATETTASGTWQYSSHTFVLTIPAGEESGPIDIQPGGLLHVHSDSQFKLGVSYMDGKICWYPYKDCPVEKYGPISFSVQNLATKPNVINYWFTQS